MSLYTPNGETFRVADTSGNIAPNTMWLEARGASASDNAAYIGVGGTSSKPLLIVNSANPISLRTTTVGGTANEQFRVAHTASAVNYVQATGAATGYSPILSAQGSNTDISIALQPKGTGSVALAAGSSGVQISNGTTVTGLYRTGTGTGYTSAPTWAAAAPTTPGVTATGTWAINITGIPTITSGGTGYAVGNVLTFVGGTSTTTATVTVSTVSSGVITAITVSNGGVYTVAPTNTISVTGGSGTGATFTALWGIQTNSYTITTAGSGYVEQPTITFSGGGGGTGAAATPIIGTTPFIKSLANSVGLQTYSTAGTMLQILDDTSSGLSQSILYVVGANSTTGRVALRSNKALYIASSSGNSISFYTAATTTSDGSRQFNILALTNAVNYLQVVGSTTGNSPILSAQGTDTNIDLTLTPKGTGRVNITTSIKPKVNSAVTVTSPLAWDSTSFDQYALTGLANALTINADANATPADGQKIMFRIKDNGTAQALTWTTGSTNSFRVIGTTLPTTTVANKTVYVGCIYNVADSRWDVVAVGQEV
jgi:hypothetical protein